MGADGYKSAVFELKRGADFFEKSVFVRFWIGWYSDSILRDDRPEERPVISGSIFLTIAMIAP